MVVECTGAAAEKPMPEQGTLPSKAVRSPENTFRHITAIRAASPLLTQGGHLDAAHHCSGTLKKKDVYILVGKADL